MKNNINTKRYLLRRMRSWTRSPRFYIQKARDRFLGIDASFYHSERELYTPGSFEWLALTEKLYGGLQLTEAYRGGDRMSPRLHNYGRCYAQFLEPFVGIFDRLTLVEVGILKGSGLAIWCDLFPRARVIGLDIDLSNFQGNRKTLEQLGAFKKNAPELYSFDQLNATKAQRVLQEVLRNDSVDIAIDDGCHCIESIEITFNAIKPFLAKRFAYFIEDNFDTYDCLARRHPEFYWTTRGEIAVATSRK
jgi:hypothetical protein